MMLLAHAWFAGAQQPAASPAEPSPRETFDPDRLEREVLATGLQDALQMDVLPNGDVLLVEMQGAVKRWRAQTRDLIEVGRVPVTVSTELGLIGIAAAGDFAQSSQVFLFFCPAAKRDVLRLSRFTLNSEGRIDLNSETRLLEYPIEFDGAIHMGGGLFFDKAKGPPHSGHRRQLAPHPHAPGRYFSRGPDARLPALERELAGSAGKDSAHPSKGPTAAMTSPQAICLQTPRKVALRSTPWACAMAFTPRSIPRQAGSPGVTSAPTPIPAPDRWAMMNSIWRSIKAGNFGHPMFNGPNEAYRSLSIDGKSAALFNPEHPLNLSPRNTGLKELPPPQPALLWYPTGPSTSFPELGSGARSAMAGPFYHFDAALRSEVKLPRHFDGVLFIHEWARNWIKAVRLTPQGSLAGIEPFAARFAFRKPIDLKLAPDQSLLVLEYGDKWHGNSDGQLLRLSYRRGNRAPVAALSASTTAGKQPLVVRFGASASRDPDGDALTAHWDFGDGRTTNALTPQMTFTQPGQYTVVLKVSDASGASHEARTVITVGNAPPQVEILAPPNGGFFDEGQAVAVQVRVTDAEDGRSDQGPDRRQPGPHPGRVSRGAQRDAVHPGLAMMRRTTCFACHTVREKSAGPPYLDVARRYEHDAPARERLAAKIIAGSSGVWGREIPMPPHPMHSLGETQLMVDWILSLARSPESAALNGLSGNLRIAGAGERQEGGVFAITAAYTDRGAPGLPPLRSSTEHILHARRRKAALHDASHGTEVVDFFEGGHGLVARLSHEGWLQFSKVTLDGISELVLNLNLLTTAPVLLELRSGSPQGPLLARTDLQDPSRGFRDITLAVTDPGGPKDLVFLARSNAAKPGGILDLNWIRFSSSHR
jgi:cytochrome c